MYKYIKTVLLKVEVNTQMRRDKKMSYSNDIFTGRFFYLFSENKCQSA